MSFENIVLASANKGKLAEFTQLFAGLNINVLPQSQFDVPDVAETGTTFVENAIIKARHASSISGMPALADDSGLVVPSLNGEPGIFSARYAGTHGDNQANNQKLLSAMHGNDDRKAFFICVLVFMLHSNDPTPLICQARWHGEIAHSLSGTQGFGYDPLFFVPEHGCTAAELESTIKNRISHRGMALAQLLRAF